jgi:hypothetical protein
MEDEALGCASFKDLLSFAKTLRSHTCIAKLR